MRCGPFTVQNIHLFNACTLRKERRYPEAFAELKKGCDENDYESLYYMANIYNAGGLGVRCDDAKYRKYRKMLGSIPKDDILELVSNADPLEVKPLVKKGIEDGYPFMTELIYVTDLGEDYIRTCAEWGDLEALYRMMTLDPKNEKYILDGANQMCIWFMHHAAQLYKSKRNATECAKWTILTESRFNMKHAIIDLVNYEEKDRLRARYLYGQADIQWYDLLNPFVTQVPPRIYKETRKKYRMGMTCWLLLAKRLGLYKDIVRFIAQILWESRMHPDEWGVTVEEEEEKERKTRKKIKV
jgi:hypothetical protein